VLKQVSFWCSVGAVVSFAFGTLPTEHGLIAFLGGTAMVIALRYAARWEGRGAR
jgi:membrane protease YdiL (CAAX protease family)